MRTHIDSSRGFTLVISLLLMLFAMILIVAVIGITRALIRESVFQMRIAQASAIAEAGMEDGLLQLRLNSSWRSGFSAKSFANGSYTVTLSTDQPPWITSVGVSQSIPLFGAAKSQVKALVQLTGGTTVQCPNLSGTSKAFIQAVVDAYDSSVNPNPTSFGFGGNICSNDKVQIQGGAANYVNGDVYYLTSPAPDPSQVRGTIYLSTFTRTVPFHNGTAFVSANNNASGISPASYYMAASKNLTVPSGVTVTIAPGIYYLNTLTISNTGTLVANTSSGTVVIYLNGTFDMDGNFTNSTNIPSKLLIYPQGSNTVNLHASSGSFYGVVEGPNASITTIQVVYGKLSGAGLSISSNFHYDKQASASSGGSVTHATWQRGSWSLRP